METIYFVVSLPRTGTSSLSKMATICNLRQNHAPHVNLFNKISRKEFDFYSDTPVFVPSVIEKICDLESVNPKFIYINRNFTEIFESWEKVGLLKDYNMMYNRYYMLKDDLGSNHSMIFDIQSYHESFDDTHMNENNYNELFQKHQDKVFQIIKDKSKDLLVYNFDMGWEPFCKFIDKGVPSEELPYLNKNKMFDKI
jgi:hypothetical protein